MTTNYVPFGLNVSVKRMQKLTGLDHLVGYADVNIHNLFLFRNLRVIKGKNGLFVSFPTEKSRKNNNYYEQIHCLNKDVRLLINKVVIESYQQPAAA